MPVFTTDNPRAALNYMTSKMDARAQRLRLLRNYLEGEAPLPEGAEGVRPAYRAFQRKARSNYAEVIVDSASERMTPSEIRVGPSSEDDDDARKLWDSNHLDIWASDVHRDMLALEKGYVTVQKNPDTDEVEIVYELPEQAFVVHDPSRPDKRLAGVKIYRDQVAQKDVAYVHLPGRVWRYWRWTFTSNYQDKQIPISTFTGGWRPDDDFNGALPDNINGDGPGEPTGVDVVPIIPFINRGEQSEYGTHLDLLDRINWTMLQRLVITAIQAYKQRAIKGDMPETDEDGKPIDYGEMFKPGPGALWQLPEGVDIWESTQTDLSGVLESAKADLLTLSAVTRTPMSALMPEGENQSAEGAAFAREGLVFRTNDRILRAKASWEEVVALGLTLLRGTKVTDVHVDFLPAERQSMAERYDALSKAGTDVPWRTKMTDILGFDGEKVDRMAVERAEDAMLAASLAPPPQAPPQGIQPPGEVTNGGSQSAGPNSSTPDKPAPSGGSVNPDTGN